MFGRFDYAEIVDAGYDVIYILNNSYIFVTAVGKEAEERVLIK